MRQFSDLCSPPKDHLRRKACTFRSTESIYGAYSPLEGVCRGVNEGWEGWPTRAGRAHFFSAVLPFALYTRLSFANALEESPAHHASSRHGKSSYASLLSPSSPSRADLIISSLPTLRLDSDLAVHCTLRARQVTSQLEWLQNLQIPPKAPEGLQQSSLRKVSGARFSRTNVALDNRPALTMLSDCFHSTGQSLLEVPESSALQATSCYRHRTSS